ncbi:MAG: MFS transporter [Sphingomonas sp.]|jgi:UMF1 family MFS transporter|uniref:MFS transporter n=1 Tax=Sphingomonas sp. TaxID=28214 RepID=UPI0035689DA2
MTADASSRQHSLPRAGLAWAIYEGGRTPYVILVMIYVFTPYVVTTMIGDPVRGQEIVSRWSQYAGWIIMLAAPVIGTSIDRIGRRKPALMAMFLLLVPLMASLWWARADGTGLSVQTTMVILTANVILLTLSELLHNSLLVRAAGRESAHIASSLGLSFGAFFALSALVLVALAFALPGKVDWSFVPARPLFGVDVALHQPERIVGPIAAVILILCAIPFFAFAPDAAPTKTSLPAALRSGATDLVKLVATLRGHREAATFLLSRMFFYDGMNAIVIYMGVFAGGVMRWGALEMLIYGVLLTLFAVIGGLMASRLDARYGPKRALQIEIGMTFLGLIAELGMSPDRILYWWIRPSPGAWRVWEGPVFRSLPELVFVVIGLFIAAFVTAHYASSRTMMTRVSPPDRMGSFFGIYALSGTATSWLAPTFVTLGTAYFHSQQGGLATLTLLLAVGLVGLTFVREPGTRK